MMYDDVRICWMGCDSMTDRLTYVLEHQLNLLIQYVIHVCRTQSECF